jgi:hypothetical protein
VAKWVLGILAVLLTASYAWAASSDGWTTFRNERFGFRLEYPTDLFRLVGSSQAGDAMVLASGDGERPASSWRFCQRRSAHTRLIPALSGSSVFCVLSGVVRTARCDLVCA